MSAPYDLLIEADSATGSSLLFRVPLDHYDRYRPGVELDVDISRTDGT